MVANQNPEQVARDNIDKMLRASGWAVQTMKSFDATKSLGVAVKEYRTDIGPADYVLFVDREPMGIIEAKKEEEGARLTMAEEQSGDYARAKLKHFKNKEPLPFVYESTGLLTRYRDIRDPEPRSRAVFTFHRPATLQKRFNQAKTLRARLQEMPKLLPEGLRDCQVLAINELEDSLKKDKPRALIQMATGAGKTFTAVTSVYRLLKHADVGRVLFLVDTKNLGIQAEQEFMAYTPRDDSRKFTELYGIQRLKSPSINNNNQVYISTIQRMYSMLKGEELSESDEEQNPAEQEQGRNREPMPVVYNENLPIEYFDYIIIDECHRSIYNLWRQVLEYFDASLIGLTATPDNRTFGFFNLNVVSEYDREQAIADGVNVPHEIYEIDTRISADGGFIQAEEFVDKRHKLTREKRWEQLDEDLDYQKNALDRDVVNPSQIRTVIKTFCRDLPRIFPDRTDVPKTLIFAKNDSHADDIIKVVREEFGKGNDFCKKVTYRADEPQTTISELRNDYNPRIAVTVDMIATGTDVKPLECLLFMRDVRSRNYFDQMTGRGTRTVNKDTLRKVTPDSHGKTHFVIVDAVGVTRSLKIESRCLERKPYVNNRDLMQSLMMGGADEEDCLTLLNRLSRINSRMKDDEREKFQELAQVSIFEVMNSLVDATNPDAQIQKAREIHELAPKAEPSETELATAQKELVREAGKPITGELIEYMEKVRRSQDQVMDEINLDELQSAGWSIETQVSHSDTISQFEKYLRDSTDELIALQIYYNQPHRVRELQFESYKELLDKLKQDRPYLAPSRIWQAYTQLEKVDGKRPRNDLTILVSVVRRVCGIDKQLISYHDQVRRNFKNWTMDKHKGNAPKYSEEQMTWLTMIRDHVINSFHFERDDLEYTPFDKNGGISKMHQLFGEDMDGLIDELNGVLVS